MPGDSCGDVACLVHLVSPSKACACIITCVRCGQISICCDRRRFVEKPLKDAQEPYTGHSFSKTFNTSPLVQLGNKKSKTILPLPSKGLVELSTVWYLPGVSFPSFYRLMYYRKTLSRRLHWCGKPSHPARSRRFYQSHERARRAVLNASCSGGQRKHRGGGGLTEFFHKK